MLTDMKIEAMPRALTGKRVSRKLARQGLVPGVLYGGSEPPVLFQVDPRRLEAVIHSPGGTNTLFVFSVEGGTDSRTTIIKDTLVDPVTGRLIHADLMRISMDKEIHVKVPIHLTGTAAGVKNQGGILDFVLREIEVSCLPGDIPGRIDADVTELELGQGLKVSDLKLPETVRVITDGAKSVAVVVAPAAEKAEAAATAEAAVEAPAEPEVIKKGKAEAGAEGAEPEAPKATEKGAKTPEKPGGKDKGAR